MHRLPAQPSMRPICSGETIRAARSSCARTSGSRQRAAHWLCAVIAALGLPGTVAAEDRVAVPFRFSGDFAIRLPPDAASQLTDHGGKLDPPVHPIGQVRALRIEGKPVELIGPVLAEGLVSTERFGQLELVVPGLNKLQLRATPTQISSIKAWLAHPEPARQPQILPGLSLESDDDEPALDDIFGGRSDASAGDGGALGSDPD